MSRSLFIVLILVTACESASTHVRATVPGLDGKETPVPNLSLVALPYDRDSVLASLEAAAAPRPHTRRLDSLFAVWRDPFGRFATASFQAGGFRDSLTTLRRLLDSLPRNAPRYQELYAQFAMLTDSLAAAEQRGEPARKELDQLRRTLLPRIDSLRLEVTAWENSTFQDYESRVKDLSTTRDPVPGVTDANGKASLKLGTGRWWVYAWAWDEGDPYSQWYWNVPVGTDTVRLDHKTGRKRPRY